jgi:uncharacterized lipoprotein YbaY
MPGPSRCCVHPTIMPPAPAPRKALDPGPDGLVYHAGIRNGRMRMRRIAGPTLWTALIMAALLQGCSSQAHRHYAITGAGTYSANLPAADGPGRILTLTLRPDGTAELVTEYVGKGDAIHSAGKWRQDGGDIRVQLLDAGGDSDGGPLTWTLVTDRLVPKSWDKSRYGEYGLPMKRSGLMAARAAQISGTVGSRLRIAWPAEAWIRLQLEDVTRPDGAPVLVAEATVRTHGKQPPVAFELPFDSFAIDPSRAYAVQADVRDKERLLFSTAAPVPVLTRGYPTKVEIEVGPPADAKIHLDLTKLDDEGLYGPPDGRRAMAFEFCIPSTEECEREVRAIDAELQLQAGAPGRIGCGPDQILCIGSTHRKDYRAVLHRLAALPYVERIEEFIGE